MASGSGLRFIEDLEKVKPTCQLSKALEILRLLGMKLEILGSLTPNQAWQQSQASGQGSVEVDYRASVDDGHVGCGRR